MLIADTPVTMAKTNDRETEEAVKNLEAVLNNDPDLPSPSPDSFGQNIQTTRGGKDLSFLKHLMEQGDSLSSVSSLEDGELVEPKKSSDVINISSDGCDGGRVADTNNNLVRVKVEQQDALSKESPDIINLSSDDEGGQEVENSNNDMVRVKVEKGDVLTLIVPDVVSMLSTPARNPESVGTYVPSDVDGSNGGNVR